MTQSDEQDPKLKKLQRMLEVAFKSSAKGIMSIAAAGAIYALFPGNLAAVMALSPVLAKLVETIGGNALAAMVEKIIALDDPTPQEIEAILQATLQETQAVAEKLDALPTRRIFYETFSALDKKQDERQEELIRWLQTIVSQLEPVEENFDTQTALNNYRQRVQEWYNTLRVLNVEKPLTAIYTDVYLVDKSSYAHQLGSDDADHEQQFARRQSDHYHRQNRRRGQDLLQSEKRLFVLGQPGAGKTTFLRWLALQAAQEALPGNWIPIYVALKELAIGTESVEALLAQQFELAGFPKSVAQQFLLDGLRDSRFLLLLDGLDELPTKRRRIVEIEVERLAKRVHDCRLVVSCREFAQTRLFEGFTYVKVADFTPDQVNAFILNWFTENKELGIRLGKMLAIPEHRPVRELTNQPLLLALLCIAYEEGKGVFPEKRHLLYEQALAAVLCSWDEMRGVRRQSAYGQLSPAKREMLLACVAYQTFAQGKLFLAQKILANHIRDWWHQWRLDAIEQQKQEYGSIYPSELPSKEVDPRKVIHEIAAQHGLLVERRNGVYSFSHLTLQEYYAARSVVENEARGSVPRLTTHVGDNRWREVFLLTASMLADAAEFSQHYLAALQGMIAGEAEIVALLKWASAKSEASLGPKLPTRPPTRRAFYIYIAALYLARTRAHSLVRARAYALNIDRARDLARDLARARDLGFDLGLALTFAYTRALDIDIALERNADLDRDPVLTRDLDLDLDFLMIVLLESVAYWPEDLASDKDFLAAVARCRPELIAWSQVLDLPVLSLALDALPWPDRQVTGADLREFSRLLREVALEHRDVGHRWELSREQWELLADYLKANRLLVECLQLATLPDRAAVEAQLLLPPGS